MRDPIAAVEARPLRRSGGRWRHAVLALAIGGLMASSAPSADAERLDFLKPRRQRAQSTTTTTAAPLIQTSSAPADAGWLDFLKPRRKRAQSTTTTTAPPTQTSSASHAPGDTGFTRIRVAIDSHAEWASLVLDGAEIEASKVVSASGSSVTSLGPTISVEGTGRTVLDFVFRIAPGTVTSLTTCRSYQGPVNVTLTRLTDAETVVANVTNGGPPRVPQSGRCENFQRDAVDRSALIGPIRWPARKDPRRLVLANYFPWYDAESLQQSFGDQPVGPANTNDPAAVAEAMNLATGSGIDGFVIEYEGTPEHTRRIHYVVEEASRRGGFYTALAIDLAILTHRHGGLPPEVLDAALHEVAARSAYPSQLRVGRDPVVFVYGASNTTVSYWEQAVDRLRQSRGIQPFAIADDASWRSPGLYEFSNSAPDRASLEEHSSGMLQHHQLEPSLYNVSGPLWVAPVSPGYDDSRVDREHKAVIPRNGGQRFDDEWAAMLASLPDWVVVTSWNEYFEQSHVMPGHTTGMRALDQLRGWTAHFHAAV